MAISLRSDVLRAAADLLLNLSAGWIGAVVIAPPFVDFYSRQIQVLLALDLIAGIVCLSLAIKLRRMARTYD